MVWTGFLSYQFVGGIAPHIAILIVIGVLAAVAGRSLHFSTWKDILPYSIAWGLCMAILNTVMSWPFIAWGVFVEPYVWMSYVLVVVVPLLCAERVSVTDEVSKWHT